MGVWFKWGSKAAMLDGNQRPVLDEENTSVLERLRPDPAVVDVKVWMEHHACSIWRMRMKSQNYSTGFGVRSHKKGNVRVLGTGFPVWRRKLDSLLA
jgi:hypothetical protein